MDYVAVASKDLARRKLLSKLNVNREVDVVKIAGYGASIPQCRITVEEIYNMWPYAFPPESIKVLMGLAEHAVNRTDEDPVTMGSDAAKAAMEMSGLPRDAVGGLFFGSFTNPYVTKSSGIIVSEILGFNPQVRCADIQYGGKSGTVAVDIGVSMVNSGVASYVVAIGADSVSRHCRPNTVFEFFAGAGAAALVLGKEGFATIDDIVTYNTDTADYFRVDGDRYINTGFAEEEESAGYENHTREAVGLYFEKTHSKASDYRYVALSQLTGKRTMNLGKSMQFAEEAITPGMVVVDIGYAGSASALIALCKLLDGAEPGDKILVASYGFGAGCDVLGITVDAGIEQARQRRKVWPGVTTAVEDKLMVDYKTYAKLERKIIQEYV